MYNVVVQDRPSHQIWYEYQYQDSFSAIQKAHDLWLSYNTPTRKNTRVMVFTMMDKEPHWNLDCIYYISTDLPI